MESKTPQTILLSHMKSKGIKIICSKTQKRPRALNFINQFAVGHQLVCQTQQYRIYNRKGKL